MPSRHALEVKARLRQGEVVFCTWLTFNDVGIAEVVGGSGYDIVLIDTEHTSVSLHDLHRSLAAMQRWDPVTIVRVPDHDPGFIKRILDVGADGIIGPMTMDAAQTEALVAACHYPPRGRRGYGPRRATDYFRDTARYMAEVDEATFVVPQIEHVEAAARAEAIAAVRGVDALCVGPMDMSGSAGVLGNWMHPAVQAGLNQVFAAAHAKGLAVCMGMSLPPSEQPAWVAKGARLVIASDDLAALRNGLTEPLAAVRRALSAAPASQ
jgi:2-keto-3-deoxy-L-rhamnonate aldolase RhmA